MVFFTVKLSNPKSQSSILHGRPWFIAGCFISVRKWEPNFVPSKSKVDSTAIWIRLPHLPTKIYNTSILQWISKKIGLLLKVDACTSAALTGRYARICVQIPLDIPVEASISINHYTQTLLYEGEGFLCKNYGHLGHTETICSYKLRTKKYENNENVSLSRTTTSGLEDTMMLGDNTQDW